MTKGSDDLEDHQDISAQKAIETRRQRLHEIQSDQTILQRRQDEHKDPIPAAPPEAVAKAQHLIQLFAAALEAQDSTPKELIACALVDLGHS